MRLVPLSDQPKRKATTLHVLTPSGTGSILPQTSRSIAELTSTAQFGMYGATVVSHLAVGTPVDVPRNQLAREVIAAADASPDREHLAPFVDSDMAFENWQFAGLLHEFRRRPGVIDIIGGACCPRVPFQEAIISVDGRQLVSGADYQQGDVVECDFLSLAFALMSVDSLRKIEEPLFRCDPNSIGLNESPVVPGCGEDQFFASKAQAVGIRLWVHSGVVIRHVDRQSGRSFTPAPPARLVTKRFQHELNGDHGFSESNRSTTTSPR